MIVWETPPPEEKRRTLLSFVLEEVRSKPGRWAMVKTFPSRGAQHHAHMRLLRDLRVRGLEGHYSFQRHADKRHYKLYVRYRPLKRLKCAVPSSSKSSCPTTPTRSS